MTCVFAVPATACRLGWLTRGQLVPAVMAGAMLELVILAASAALCGRLYCSIACPLGIAQDLAHFCLRWLPFARPAGRPSTATRIVRLALLAGFALGAVFGLTGLFEPYGIFGRFIAAGVRRVGEPTALAVIWALSLFAAILVAAVFRARWWCNRVCPVGTLLGLASKRAPLHVRVDAARCARCGLCASRCDKGALTVRADKSIAVDTSSCVLCLNCIGSCRKEALKWH